MTSFRIFWPKVVTFVTFLTRQFNLLRFVWSITDLCFTCKNCKCVRPLPPGCQCDPYAENPDSFCKHGEMCKVVFYYVNLKKKQKKIQMNWLFYTVVDGLVFF